MTLSVADIMTSHLVSFTPQTNIHKAIHVLLEKRLSGAPVVDGSGALVGIISKKDCLKIVFSTGYHQDQGGLVSEYMSTNVQTLDFDMNLIDAAEHFIKSNFRRFPVMQDGKLVGQISRHDILKSLIKEA